MILNSNIIIQFTVELIQKELKGFLTEGRTYFSMIGIQFNRQLGRGTKGIFT